MAEQTDVKTEVEVIPLEGSPDTPVTQEQAPVRTFTETETRALAQGWVPKELFSGQGKWRDAEEFLDRGELFSKIDEQNRRIKAQELTAVELKKHLEKVRKTEYTRALESLRAEKKAALIEGNADAVVEIDDKIANVREEAKQADVQAAMQERMQAQQDVPNPVIVQWMNRNPWYNQDKAMKVYADSVGHEMATAGETNPRAILEEVERRTKKEFAHKFVNPNRDRAGTVETGGARGARSNDTFELSEAETRVMNKFVKAGVMTRDEYIKDIKAERGLK